MERTSTQLRKRLTRCAGVTLVAGLTGGVLIYLTAGDGAESTLVEEFENSKMYRHDLELYGGKVNVLASDIMRWFDSLWHGRALALTVVCISLVVAGGIYFVARHLPPDDGGGEGDGRGSGRSGDDESP